MFIYFRNLVLGKAYWDAISPRIDESMHWEVDAAFAADNAIKTHTGETLSLGCRNILCSPAKKNQ